MEKKKRKSKIILIVLLLVVIGLLAASYMVFRAVPKSKFEKTYDVPHGLSAEETIEKYFEYIGDRNPAKANMLWVKPALDAYSCVTVKSAKVNNIDNMGKTIHMPYSSKDIYDNVECLVNYDCEYWFDWDGNGPFWNGTNSIFFYLIKETEDSDWKIADIYNGP